MTAARIVAPAIAILLSACAQAPVAPVVAEALAPLPPLPFVTSSGLIIGTVSYQYVEAGADDTGPVWTVHLVRIDDPAQDFALSLEVDPASRRGVFTGALPAGVYALRDAATPRGRYAPPSHVPFEVQAGEVRDAGHYALSPQPNL